MNYSIRQLGPKAITFVERKPEHEGRYPLFTGDAPPTVAQMWDAARAFTPFKPVNPAAQALADAEKSGVTVGGITLAASEQDRNKFTQLLIMLREAEAIYPDEAKPAFRSSIQTIIDAAGAPHTMSVTDLRALLLAYGVAYQTLWAAAKTS